MSRSGVRKHYPKGLTLGEIAQLTKSKVVGDDNLRILGVADLESAQSDDISFLGNLRYQQAMQKSQAGAVIVDASIPLEPGRHYLISENPSKAFQDVIEVLYPADFQEKTGFKGIHPTAVIHPTASIGKEVTIGPYAVIR